MEGERGRGEEGEGGKVAFRFPRCLYPFVCVAFFLLKVARRAHLAIFEKVGFPLILCDVGSIGAGA